MCGGRKPARNVMAAVALVLFWVSRKYSFKTSGISATKPRCVLASKKNERVSC